MTDNRDHVTELLAQARLGFRQSGDRTRTRDIDVWAFPGEADSDHAYDFEWHERFESAVNLFLQPASRSDLAFRIRCSGYTHG